MADRVVRMSLAFHYYDHGQSSSTQVCYTPIVSDEAGQERGVTSYYNSVSIPAEQISQPLKRKLLRLTDYIRSTALNPLEVELDDGTVLRAQQPRLVEYEYFPDPRPTIRVRYRATPNDSNLAVTDVPVGAMTQAAQRLINNMMPMYDRIAWDDFRARVGGQPPVNQRKKVLISYRKTGQDRMLFARAIADRLGRESFLPWFDEWEIHAGDSLPREITEGFQGVYAVVIVLTEDYPKGKWAREELETAITKRVEQEIRVIPVLFEPCERPELLRALRYVDCTDHGEEKFEIQFREIIDALNEIELNPYR